MRVRMPKESIEDHQHPDIIHKVYIGGPYTDRFLTKKQKKSGERSTYYVDTKADVKGEMKVVRTEFKDLFTANAFIKAMRENPEVDVDRVKEISKAQILLQGRSVKDDKMLIEYNEKLLVEELRSAFSTGDSKDVIFNLLNRYLRDVTIMIREKISVTPSYIELEKKEK